MVIPTFSDLNLVCYMVCCSLDYLFDLIREYSITVAEQHNVIHFFLGWWGWDLRGFLFFTHFQIMNHYIPNWNYFVVKKRKRKRETLLGCGCILCCAKYYCLKWINKQTKRHCCSTAHSERRDWFSNATIRISSSSWRLLNMRLNDLQRPFWRWKMTFELCQKTKNTTQSR